MDNFVAKRLDYDFMDNFVVLRLVYDFMVSDDDETFEWLDVRNFSLGYLNLCLPHRGGYSVDERVSHIISKLIQQYISADNNNNSKKCMILL